MLLLAHAHLLAARSLLWGSGGDLIIQNVHAPTLGTKLNCQISAVFGLADIPEGGRGGVSLIPA